MPYSDSVSAESADISIRAFEKSFQREARTLILQGLGEHWGWIDETLNPDLDDIVSAYKEGYFATLWRGDHLIGTGGIKPAGPGVCRIERMSILKAERGRGFGARILDELVSWARKLECRLVVLETNSSWQEVVRFYRRYGFDIVDVRGGASHFELILDDL